MSYAFIFYGFKVSREIFFFAFMLCSLTLLFLYFSFALSEWEKTANCCLSSNNYLFTFRPKVISNQTSVMFFNSAFCILHFSFNHPHRSSPSGVASACDIGDYRMNTAEVYINA